MRCFWGPAFSGPRYQKVSRPIVIDSSTLTRRPRKSVSEDSSPRSARRATRRYEATKIPGGLEGTREPARRRDKMAGQAPHGRRLRRVLPGSRRRRGSHRARLRGVSGLCRVSKHGDGAYDLRGLAHGEIVSPRLGDEGIAVAVRRKDSKCNRRAEPDVEQTFAPIGAVAEAEGCSRLSMLLAKTLEPSNTVHDPTRAPCWVLIGLRAPSSCADASRCGAFTRSSCRAPPARWFAEMLCGSPRRRPAQKRARPNVTVAREGAVHG